LAYALEDKTGTIPAANMAATSDLDTIIRTGKLRVLYKSRKPASSPVSNTERLMLERFAREYKLELQWVPADARWGLLPKLVAGEGDIIVGHGRSIAAGMLEQVCFTLPWVTSHQQVIARADTTQISALDDLAARQVALQKSSPAWPTMQELAENIPTMDLVLIPENLSQEKIMGRVASGQYDLTIADSDFVKDYLPHHPELSAVFDLNNGEARSWAVRNEAVKLQEALNRFLNKNHLEFNVTQVYLEDLPGIKERKLLRLITYNSPGNYFFSDGRFHGFEYELLRKFARSEKMRIDVVLASSHEEMQQLLLNGAGDIIAAALPKDSITDNKIQFTAAYDFSMPIIISRQSDTPILDIRDLAGRSITLSAESPYRSLLERIRAHGISFDIRINDPGIDTEATIAMVGRGMFDLTVIDSNRYNKVLAEEYAIKAQFALSEPAPHAWAVRSNDVQLLTGLNEYIEKEYHGEFYNTLHARYIEYSDKINAREKFLAQVDRLSPYDNLVRKYAELYGFDWRLIVAQMYQESRFNPAATSHVGAEGLMQIMPSTAEDIGAKNLADPADSIKAGIKYLGMLRDQFENDLLLEDRTWFSLASYNAGFGRVKRARQLAAEMGLDADRWFGNVEKAMMALAKPYKKDGEIVRNCRCGETVVYVHEIRVLYNNYVRLTQTVRLAANSKITRSVNDI
jgi:membrane-bound lytic murein transglycosylase F